jgi:hypothetical protein
MSLPEIHFGGAEEFRAMAARVNGLDFGRASRRGIEAAVVPLKVAVAAEPAKRLPRRGGLARQVAKTRISTQTRMRGPNANVRLAAASNAVKDPAAINRGRLLKPTFGHRPWTVQQVRPGWFTEPLVRGAPLVRRSIEAAISGEVRKG